MIGIVLEQFRKIENSSRTLEHVFAGVGLLEIFKLITIFDHIQNLLTGLEFAIVRQIRWFTYIGVMECLCAHNNGHGVIWSALQPFNHNKVTRLEQ